MELWYKFYGTCDDINVVCLASHNISSPRKKKCYGSQKEKENFEAENIVQSDLHC